MKLTDNLAKKIGNALKVDFNKIKLKDFIKGIKSEEEHKDLVGNPKVFNIKDYVLFAKIAHKHLSESPTYYEELEKMENKLKKENIIKFQFIINKMIKEDINFRHKLKFEVSKNDANYQLIYNKKLGKFHVDSPDQLDDVAKESFFKEIDDELKKLPVKKEMAFSSGRSGSGTDGSFNQDDNKKYGIPMTGQDSSGSGDEINNYDYKTKNNKVKAIKTDENAIDDRYNATKNQYENIKLPNLELVSSKVHDEWMKTKKSQGITSRKSETGEELMVPYEKLSEKAKDLDRNTVKAIFSAIKSIKNESNWIQGAVKHPGKCTPMSNPECTGHAKALAKRFKSGDIHQDNLKKDNIEVKAEVHPVGREAQVNALKKKFPEKSAYKIAWSQAEKAKSPSNPEGKPKKNEVTKIQPVTETEEIYEFSLEEAEAIIRHQIDEFVRKSGSGWKVYSHEGKPLSKEYPSKSEAVKRLKQIEFFKYNK